MNFLDKIISAGFVEQSMKKIYEYNIQKGRVDKANQVPKWWEKFPTSQNWFGLSLYEPDAHFSKNNSEVILSLHGCFIEMSVDEIVENLELNNSQSLRYIRMSIDNRIIYKTFSGLIPSDRIIDEFIELSK